MFSIGCSHVRFLASNTSVNASPEVSQVFYSSGRGISFSSLSMGTVLASKFSARGDSAMSTVSPDKAGSALSILGVTIESMPSFAASSVSGRPPLVSTTVLGDKAPEPALHIIHIMWGKSMAYFVYSPIVPRPLSSALAIDLFSSLEGSASVLVMSTPTLDRFSTASEVFGRDSLVARHVLQMYQTHPQRQTCQAPRHWRSWPIPDHAHLCDNGLRRGVYHLECVRPTLFQMFQLFCRRFSTDLWHGAQFQNGQGC